MYNIFIIQTNRIVSFCLLGLRRHARVCPFRTQRQRRRWQQHSAAAGSSSNTQQQRRRQQQSRRERHNKKLACWPHPVITVNLTVYVTVLTFFATWNGRAGLPCHKLTSETLYNMKHEAILAVYVQFLGMGLISETLCNLFCIY